jgi:glutamate N-acetyltransferase/amino-acid N-acetyltransferase
MANGISAGIKSDGKRDLSLIVSAIPARAAGVFTTNSFKAAPVVIDMGRIKSGYAQAILTNSGNANAATGLQGYRDALLIGRKVARSLNMDEDLVLVASTGVIGQRLPVRSIIDGMEDLVRGLRGDGLQAAEEAIMTTDWFPKMASRRCRIDGRVVTVFGMAKGAGMIEPNMATMLAFFLTDADIDTPSLKRVFREVIDQTFNAISVDGCMSTNDTALILANGVAGNRTLKASSQGINIFKHILYEVAAELARSMVRDGEGATKVIDIRVEKARTRQEAAKVAYAIARSNLVKTAFYGGDPNWGRIISAAGSVGIALPVDKVVLRLEGKRVFGGGKGIKVPREVLKAIMTRDEISLTLQLGMGSQCWRVLASDLTHEYVNINAHYHT